MSGIARHDARTLFERAWTHGVRTGLIDAQRREALVAEATRAIRRIATVLGTEYLRTDLERAMRAMLGLVELNLRKASGGDVEAAARSIAVDGLLAHTRGASRAIKRLLAIEQGVDPDAPDPDSARRFEAEVVSHWPQVPFDEFLRRQEGAERVRRRRHAARALATALRGEAPDEWYEPEQVILTVLLVLDAGGREWPADRRAFERLLGAARERGGVLEALPPGVPPAQREVAEEVRREGAAAVAAAIADRSIPLHRLVAGGPDSNPLHDRLVLPEGGLGDVDAHGHDATEHWRTLTGGRTDDEAHLLWTMLREIRGARGTPPLAWKETEAQLATTLAAPADERAFEAWLDANAPHAYHGGLRELWQGFWQERAESLHEDSTPSDVRRFLGAWLPMKAAAPRKADASGAGTRPAADRAGADRAGADRAGAGTGTAAGRGTAGDAPASDAPARTKAPARKAVAEPASADGASVGTTAGRKAAGRKAVAEPPAAGASRAEAGAVKAPGRKATGAKAPAAEGSASKGRAAKGSATKAPATKAPAPKASATKAPATKAPATKASATKASATKASATKAPATKAPATKAPATKASATKARATEARAAKATATKASATKAPGTKASTAKASATKAPVTNTPARKASATKPPARTPSKAPAKPAPARKPSR
ncbi:MAG TPA: hypothetical protein VEA81_14540 [Burkholderiaceae bacterium]|nr:hypothetical protein [Burkholderiaceae bacterium]